MQPKPAIIAVGRPCMPAEPEVRIHFPPAASLRRLGHRASRISSRYARRQCANAQGASAAEGRKRRKLGHACADAMLTLYALLNSGFLEEAAAWRDWLLRAIAGSPVQMQIMYGIAGECRLTEYEVRWLRGYEEAAPWRAVFGCKQT